MVGGLMGRTLRSKKLRWLLWKAADGKCQICGCDLDPGNWHADHIEPFSRTGRTNVHEMQATCPTCNLKKGSSMIPFATPRQHQIDAETHAKEMVAGMRPSNCLVHVVPGGGKSSLPPIMASVLGCNIAWFVPRRNLRSQAAEDAKSLFGMDLMEVEEADNDGLINPRRGTRGFVATHSMLAGNALSIAHELQQSDYLLVIDEVHHAKETLDNSARNALASAMDKLRAKYHVLMTGTIRTNDAKKIVGVQYKQHPDGWRADRDCVDVEYRRVDALGISQGPAIVPVHFFHHDGPVKWRDVNTGRDVQVEKLSDASRQQERAAKHTALSSDMSRQMLDDGVDHWNEHGIKLLVVTADQDKAREAQSYLASRGVTAEIAISRDGTAAQEAIKRFRDKRRLHDKGALITVAMAYEGLDVKTITHGICLTHYRSIPWLEQMLARAWRVYDGKQHCSWWVPNDPQMNRAIQTIHDEQEQVLRAEEDKPKPPPPPSGYGYIPLDGSTREVIKSILGSDHKRWSEEERQLVAALEASGVDLSSEHVKKVLEEVRHKSQDTCKSSGIAKTARDELKQRKAHLKSLCKSYNRAQGLEDCQYGGPRSAEYKVKAEFDKGVGKMTTGEVERAIVYMNRLLSRHWDYENVNA